MADSSTRQLSVLFIKTPDASPEDLQELVGDRVALHVAETPQAAADILQHHAIDLVLHDAQLWRMVSGSSLAASAGAVFESTCQGICTVDATGQMIVADESLQQAPEPVQREVRDFCMRSFDRLASVSMEARLRNPLRVHGFDHQGEMYEMWASPVVDAHGEVTCITAVVWQATRTRRLQQKINAIDKAAEELVSLDAEQIARLDMQERLDLLEQKVIRYTRELLDFDNFTVHILDKRTNKLELVLSSGMPSHVHEIPIYATPEGNGVCGWVASYGKSYICPDVSRDSRYIAGMDGALSSLTVPLELHDKVIGVFNIESKELAAFNEDDRQFAEIFGRHIAMALHILNLLVRERHKTTGQLASDVMSEITAPLNDMLTDIGNLMDDFIGHDEIRHRLHQVNDNAVRIREALKHITSRKPGLVDRHRSSGSVRHDPVLNGRRILVADDEEVIRDTVCDVLRSYGCTIESAEDGDRAIRKLEQENFDLVLSDIKMPGRSGYEIFAAAKDRDKNCPVILMTGFGYDPNHSIVRARREGLAAVLFKPFKVEQLLGEIRTAIRSARQT